MRALRIAALALVGLSLLGGLMLTPGLALPVAAAECTYDGQGSFAGDCYFIDDVQGGNGVTPLFSCVPSYIDHTYTQSCSVLASPPSSGVVSYFSPNNDGGCDTWMGGWYCPRHLPDQYTPAPGYNCTYDPANENYTCTVPGPPHGCTYDPANENYSCAPGEGTVPPPPPPGEPCPAEESGGANLVCNGTFSVTFPRNNDPHGQWSELAVNEEGRQQINLFCYGDQPQPVTGCHGGATQVFALADAPSRTLYLTYDIKGGPQVASNQGPRGDGSGGSAFTITYGNSFGQGWQLGFPSGEAYATIAQNCTTDVAGVIQGTGFGSWLYVQNGQSAKVSCTFTVPALWQGGNEWSITLHPTGGENNRFSYDNVVLTSSTDGTPPPTGGGEAELGPGVDDCTYVQGGGEYVCAPPPAPETPPGSGGPPLSDCVYQPENANYVCSGPAPPSPSPTPSPSGSPSASPGGSPNPSASPSGSPGPSGTPRPGYGPTPRAGATPGTVGGNIPGGTGSGFCLSATPGAVGTPTAYGNRDCAPVPDGGGVAGGLEVLYTKEPVGTLLQVGNYLGGVKDALTTVPSGPVIATGVANPSGFWGVLSFGAVVNAGTAALDNMANTLEGIGYGPVNALNFIRIALDMFVLIGFIARLLRTNVIAS